MRLEVFGKTDNGLKRELNEDTILVNKHLSTFIVADGMGGHKGGKEASLLATQMASGAIAELLEARTSYSGEEILFEAYQKANLAVYRKSKSDKDLSGMGTTMVSAFHYQNRLYIGNVGDSRAYLFRRNKLWQLTEDHSWVNEQVKAGVIHEEDKPYVTGQNVITRCIGLEESAKVDILERGVQDLDRVLLCSDGLTGLVSGEKIADICQQSSLTKVVFECIKEAKDAGGTDNISVIVIDFHF